MQGQGSAVKNWRALPLGGYPAIFGKNAGARQCSKKLASATAGGLPLYLWENARAGQCSKNWRALLGGYPSILQEQGSAVKIGERYRWGATPLSLGKMQGQGSAVKSWSALLGKCRGRAVQEKIGERYRWGLPYLWENARAGQCSKRLASAAGGYPFGKNMGALIPTNTP